MLDFRQAVILFCTTTILIYLISFLLLKLIALKSPPSIRASWTAGLAYIGATIIFLLNADEEYYNFWPAIAGMPAAAYAYWSFHKDFRKSWIDDPDKIESGINLANDDWKVGAMRLLVIFVIIFFAAIGGGLGRELAQGILG